MKRLKRPSVILLSVLSLLANSVFAGDIPSFAPQSRVLFDSQALAPQTVISPLQPVLDPEPRVDTLNAILEAKLIVAVPPVARSHGKRRRKDIHPDTVYRSRRAQSRLSERHAKWLKRMQGRSFLNGDITPVASPPHRHSTNEHVVPVHIPPFVPLHRLHQGNKFARAVGYAYSRMKLGSPDEIRDYARRMVERMKIDLGAEIAKDPSRWVVVYSSARRIPHASTLVAIRVAELLGVPLARLATKPFSVSENISQYSQLSGARDRKRLLGLSKGRIEPDGSITRKHVIFFDDSVVTGTVLDKCLADLSIVRPSTIYAYVLVQLISRDAKSYEHAFNQMAIGPDPVISYAEIIRNPKTVFVTGLLSHIYHLPPNDLVRFLASLSAEQLLNLYVASALYFGASLPAQADRIADALYDRAGIRFPASEQFHNKRGIVFWNELQAVHAGNGFHFSWADAPMLLNYFNGTGRLQRAA